MEVRRYNKYTTYTALIICSIIALFPLFWIVTTSFKPRMLTFVIPPRWFFTPTLQNYRELFQVTKVTKNLANSLFIAGWSTIAAASLGCIAAFSFARLRISRKEDIIFWILSTRMIPPIVTLIPMFLIFRTWGLYDTHLGVILFHTAANLPLVVWVMRSFIAEIPSEVEESAMVDGCSHLGAFWKITLPLTLPALLATGILSFIASWNEFMGALILTGDKAKTLPVLTMSFISAKGIMWGRMTAGATLIIIPIVIFVIFIQKYLTRGLSFGMFK